MLSKIAAFSALLAATTAAPSPGPTGFGRPKHVTTNAASTSDWDYIVAGAGAAGIIVAQRLAEQNKRVLLLERGDVSYASTGGNASTSWDTKGLTPYDVPSQFNQIFSTGIAHMCPDTPGAAGCLLGGGVTINAMVFVPPPQHDFNNWPAGWKWSDIEASANDLYARNPGTINPSLDGKYYDTDEFDILSSFLNTQNFSNVDPIQNPNEKTAAYTHPPWNIKDGQRAGPVMTYLPLAQNLTNFSLQLNTAVVRVVRRGSKVTGVEVQDSITGARSVINICPTGRVVLAAGSMTTPRLLINSGIGPTDQIKIVQAGTTNVTLPAECDWINLPVGTEIKDHPMIDVAFKANVTLPNFAAPSLAEQESYLSSRTGVLAQGLQRLIFWDSVNGSDGITRYVQGTTSVSSNSTIRVRFYLTHGLQSVGTLGVTPSGATNLTTRPYFTNSVDTATLSSYIANFIAQASEHGLKTVNSTATVADYFRDNFATGSHYVGTAKIGTDDGRVGGSAVVDTQTRVYGTDNLFVVDASIHPDLPTGNTQAIVMVVAEKAAKVILAAR